MPDPSEFDQLFEMTLAAKPYLRDALERMRADVVTLGNPLAEKGFGEFLRKVLVSSHSEAIQLIDSGGRP